MFRHALAGALPLAWLASPVQVSAHDIYTGLQGKNGQLCCGGSDCAATVYRERGGSYEFLTREKAWVSIPAERITFLPVPGDPPSSESHLAHLCYRASPASDNSGIGPLRQNTGQFGQRVRADLSLLRLHPAGRGLTPRRAPAADRHHRTL